MVRIRSSISLCFVVLLSVLFFYSNSLSNHVHEPLSSVKISETSHPHQHEHDHANLRNLEHAHGADQSPQLLFHKLGTFVFIGIVGLLGVIVPVFLQPGTFVGLAFFHLLPEALYTTHHAGIGWKVGHSWYSGIFLLAFLGFSLILLFDKIAVAGSKSDVGHLVHSHSHGGECDHDHSHDEVESVEEGRDDKQSLTQQFTISTLLMTISLCVHTIFEGIIVGTFEDALSVWIAALSICGHKWAEGFALSCNLAKANLGRSGFYTLLGVFILSTPVGILLGIVFSSSNQVLVGAIDSISLGAILYTSFELIFDEFGTTNSVLKEFKKFGCMVTGAMIIFGLSIVHFYGSGHQH